MKITSQSSSSRNSNNDLDANKICSRRRRICHAIRRWFARIKPTFVTKLGLPKIQASDNKLVQDSGSTEHSAEDVSSPPPNFLEQSLDTFRFGSFRRHNNNSHIQLLDESWEDWLVSYQHGDKNLSDVGRPTCFNGYGYMAPPLFRHEIRRLRIVNKLSDVLMWRSELGWLSTELLATICQYRLKGATVALLEKNVQQILWQTGMGYQFQSVSRDLSLDGHTVLSKDHFALLDCSSDWRTRLNPLVHGPPFIKFYLGVNIVIDQVPVGCIAVYDPYLKTKVPTELVDRLKQMSDNLSRALTAAISRKSERRSSRIQWNEESAPNDLLESSAIESTHSRSTETASLLSFSTEHSSTKSMSSVSLVEDSKLGVSVAGVTEYSATLQPIFCQPVFQPFEVFESLLRCSSIPQAIKKACRIIQHNLGADVTYLVEIRCAAENTSCEPKTHLVGYCKPQVEVDVSTLAQSHFQLALSAIRSYYGIHFMNGVTGSEPVWSGMAMPFRRKPAESTKLKFGGFVMTVLYEDPHRKPSPGDQAFLKKVVRALANILTCYHEIDSVKDGQVW